MEKPKDMLEFLRRTSGDASGDAPAPPPETAAALQPTTRMLVLRRSQVLTAAAAMVAALVLAFLLGMAAGGGGDVETALGSYVIKAAAYKDTAEGRDVAKAVKRQLEAEGFGPVQVLKLETLDQVAVTVMTDGDPASSASRAALRRIQEMKDRRTGKAPFEGASFVRVR